MTAGLALRPLESLPPNGRTAPSRQRRISLKVTLPRTICDGPVMMQSASGLVSNHQRMIPAIQKSLPTMLPEYATVVRYSTTDRQSSCCRVQYGGRFKNRLLNVSGWF